MSSGPAPIGPGAASPLPAPDGKKPMSTAGILFTAACLLAIPAAVLVGIWWVIHVAWRRWPDATAVTLTVVCLAGMSYRLWQMLRQKKS